MHPPPPDNKPPADNHPFLNQRTIVGTLMAAALCWTAWLNLQSTYTTGILATITGNARDPLTGIDSVLQQATHDGNAAVLFDGFSPNQSQDVSFVTKIYFRGNYVAYPRRVFVCDDAGRFDRKQIAAGQFAPSDTWLIQHNVRCVIRFTSDPAGHVQCTLHKL